MYVVSSAISLTVHHNGCPTPGMDCDDGPAEDVAPIPLWRTPGDIRRRATYDDRYAAWVECHAPEGTEEAIAQALDAKRNGGSGSRCSD